MFRFLQNSHFLSAYEFLTEHAQSWLYKSINLFITYFAMRVPAGAMGE